VAIDDEVEKSDAEAIVKEAEKSAQEMILRSQIAGLISAFLPPWLFPISVAFNEGLNQLTTRRFYTRLQGMRDAMNARLQEVDDSKVDKDWFLSEEFQTMLFESARQVTATADRKKIAMLGTRWQMAVSRSSAQKAEKSCSCRSSVISHLSTLRCCGDSCLTIRCQPRSDGVRGPHLPEQTKIWWCCKCLLQVVSSRNL